MSATTPRTPAGTDRSTARVGFAALVLAMGLAWMWVTQWAPVPTPDVAAIVADVLASRGGRIIAFVSITVAGFVAAGIVVRTSASRPTY